MHWLMTTQVRRHHLRYETTGHLWQGRFRSHLVGTDAYLLNLLRYIEGNPVRAGLVASARSWRWSSMTPDEQVSSQALLAWRPQLSEPPVALPDDWLAFVDTPLSESELSELSTGGTVPDQRDQYGR